MSTRTTTTTNRGSSTTSTTLSSPSSIIVCSAMASVPLSAAVSSISANLPAYAPSILGGLSIGLLAVAQLAIGGRVLGISGAVRGIVSAPLSMDRNQVFRYLFVGGLLAGGILLPYLPGGATATAASLSASRVATAGLLVGVGTSLSNGCTSGHCICDMSRLSARSILSTCIFMLFGALAVSLLSGAQSVGLPAGFIVPAVDQALTTICTIVLKLLERVKLHEMQKVNSLRKHVFRFHRLLPSTAEAAPEAEETRKKEEKEDEEELTDFKKTTEGWPPTLFFL